MKKHRFYLWCIMALLLLIPNLAFAQDLVSVQGTVTDELGDPLIGVSIKVVGTTNGAITDIDGAYAIKNVPRGGVLEFSYLGYVTQTIKVTANRLSVSMQPDNQLLDEVVVIAYGTQKKLTVTGSVSNVGSIELLKSPAASLGNAIAGKLPGVMTVQYSGMPGADDPVIRVRGVGTTNSGAQEPLVLVDGVERPFTQIDPNEVEDITILKDASATAVFGVRGANGVILVTTKRGQTGKPSVSFSSSAGYQQITQFINTVGSYEYATAYNNAQLSDGVAPGNLKYSQTAIENWENGTNPVLYPNTDWKGMVLKDGAWQEQYNVSVSGGTDKAAYFVSLGMLNQDGLFKTFDTNPESNFKYRRYNFRGNIDINFSPINKLSIGIGGRSENRNLIGDGEDSMFSNLFQAVPMSGYGLDEQGRSLYADPNLVGTYGRNALEQFYNLGYVKQSKNILNLDLAYNLKLDVVTKGLSFNIKGSYNSDYTQRKNRKNGYGTGSIYIAREDPTGENDYVVSRERNSVYWPLPYSESREGNRNWYAETNFNYARSFGLHNVGGLLLYNQSKRYYPKVYTDIPSGYVGLVGRATYDYDSRYLLDMNVGYNGSENFAPGKRYGLFPSASVGWVASSENFWEPIKDAVSFLKLRASIGKVGNDAIGDNRFLYLDAMYDAFSGTRGYGDNGLDNRGTAIFGLTSNTWRPGAKEKAQGNPDVTWETALKQNYGVDVKFFKNKLSLSADFFFEDRKNILVSNSAILPGIFGTGTNSLNRGRVKNHGYELVFKWEDRIGDFRYSIAPSLSFARNKVIEMLEVKQDYDNLYQTGHPVNQPFGYDFFEFYEPGKTEERYLAKYGAAMPDQGASVKAGDCIYVDLTGDGIIDNNDRKAIGFTDVPEYNAALNLQFSYKGFDLSMLIIGATNTSRSLGTYYRPQFGSTNTACLQEWVYEKSWTPENAENALLPRLSFVNQTHNTRNSDVWLVDASYARLKNAEIGYTFKLASVPQIGSIRVYANGYNLLTFSEFKANDPESSASTMKYPMTRTYNFGLKVNF